MTRPIILVALGVLVTGACGGGGEGIPEPVIQTGCLSGSEGRFVLTDLERGDTEAQPSATTEMFQLVGNEDELRQHVGKQVRVTGEAEPASVTEARETSPPTPTATGGQDEPKPKVSTQSQTRVETSRLRVSSVTPTGDDCAEQVP